MIVNPHKQGWEVIYQRAHALLAAKIAAQWKNPPFPEYWTETLAAIAQHDDGGREWEGENYLTEAGAPQDFTQGELSDHQPREMTTNSQYQGRWVALLTSMHMNYLYEAQRGKLAALDHLLDEQIEKQKRWRRELKLNKREAQQVYSLVQWCDRLSLILCKREVPARGRKLEIGKGPDGVKYAIQRLEADKVHVVTPWPFSTDHFTLSIEATILTQLSFPSGAALTQALQTGQIKTLTWELSQ